MMQSPQRTVLGLSFFMGLRWIRLGALRKLSMDISTMPNRSKFNNAVCGIDLVDWPKVLHRARLPRPVLHLDNVGAGLLTL